MNSEGEWEDEDDVDVVEVEGGEESEEGEGNDAQIGDDDVDDDDVNNDDDDVILPSDGREEETDHLNRRQRSQMNMVGGFPCPSCDAIFKRKRARDYHFTRSHSHGGTIIYECMFCAGMFDSIAKLTAHREVHQPSNGFFVYKNAFRGVCIIYRKIHGKKVISFDQAFMMDRKEIYDIIKYELSKRTYMRFSINYHIEFVRDALHMPEKKVLSEMCCRTITESVYNEYQIDILIHKKKIETETRIEDYLENGSGWNLRQILCVDLEICTLRPLNGSCGLLSVTYAKDLNFKTNKKFDLKKRPSNDCFLKAIAHYFTKSRNEATLRKFIRRELKVRIPLPVAVKDVAKFERHNQHLGLRITIILFQEKELTSEEEDDIDVRKGEDKKLLFFPKYCSKIDKKNAIHNITLVLYKTRIGRTSLSHYSHVKSLNVLLRREYRCKNGKKIYEQALYCPNCFNKFKSRNKNASAKRLEEHEKVCLDLDPRIREVPKRGEKIKFRNFINKFPSYYVGFWDIETIHKKTKHACEKCKVGDDECMHQTTIDAIQVPVTISYLILDIHDRVVVKRTFTDKNCIAMFVDDLLSLESELIETLSSNHEMEITRRQEQQFQSATHCHICEKAFLDEDNERDIKVRDHSHIEKKFLGASHRSCNLLRRERKTIPFFAHGMTHFDGHFLIKQLGIDPRIKKLEALPKNSQAFRCLRVNQFLFCDSFAFLPTSLGELVSDLAKDANHPWPIMDQLDLYPRGNQRLKKLLVARKLVFPYTFCTSISKMINQRSLPPIEDFFSTLKNAPISQQDYDFADLVFREFNCRSIFGLNELYCTVDCGQLAEVFTKFRKTIKKDFNLDCW